jgi:hypothetical protein
VVIDRRLEAYAPHPTFVSLPLITFLDFWRSFLVKKFVGVSDSRLEGGVNRAKLKFTKIITTTSRVSVRNINESAREGAKQIASK